MSALTLTLRNTPEYDVDISPLVPDQLEGLEREAIQAIELPGGARVAALFEVAGEDAQHLIVRNASEKLTHVGSRMKTGTIMVEGNCGAYAGLGMCGGRLTVGGNTSGSVTTQGVSCGSWA